MRMVSSSVRKSKGMFGSSWGRIPANPQLPSKRHFLVFLVQGDFLATYAMRKTGPKPKTIKKLLY
jgi:hypothetical protein